MASIGDILKGISGISRATAAAKKIETQITDEIFEGVGAVITQAIDAGRQIINGMIGNIYASDMWFRRIMTNPDSGFDPYTVITKGAILMGMIILVLLVVYYIAKYFLFHSELKQTPWNVLGKAILCTVIIFEGFNLYANFIFPAYSQFGNAVVTYAFTGGGDNGDNPVALTLSDWLPGDLDSLAKNNMPTVPGEDGKRDHWVFGVQASCIFTGILSCFGPLIMLLIAWPVVKSIFGAFLEMAERYIVTMFLLLFMPIFIATAVLQDTENVWKSYMRMIFSSTILLVLYTIFFKVGLLGIQMHVTYGSLQGYVLTLAYWKFAKRIDIYINALGLNLAQTGGQVFDAMGAGMQTILKEISRGGEFRNAAASGMKAVGAGIGGKTGAALIDAGSTVGASLTNLPFAATGNIGKKAIADSIAKAGGEATSFGLEQDTKMIMSYMSNPTANRDTIGALSKEAQASALQNAIGKDGNGNPLLNNIRDISNNNGVFSFTATDASGDTHDYSYSLKNDGLGMQVSEGFLNTVNEMNEGDTITGTAPELFGKTGALGLTEGASAATITDAKDLGTVTSASMGKGGSVTYNDAAGNGVVKIDGKGRVFQKAPIDAYDSGHVEKMASSAQRSLGVSQFKDSYGQWNSSPSRAHLNTDSQGRHYYEVKMNGSTTMKNLYVSDGVSERGHGMDKSKVIVNSEPGGLHNTLTRFEWEVARPEDQAPDNPRKTPPSERRPKPISTEPSLGETILNSPAFADYKRQYGIE